MSETTVMEGLAPELQAAMARQGYAELTAVQRAVLSAQTHGRDLRISSQTGSGKTVAIGMVLAPELQGERTRSPAALVITPTRELATQVQRELDWLYADIDRTAVVAVTGGSDIVKERKALGRKPRVVVATPGRLLDHIRSGSIDCGSVRHVVLDEADQMLDMGFREDLEAIVDALPEERRSHLVSATFPQMVRHLADRFQSDAVHVQGSQLGVANEDIEHVAHLVRGRDMYPALVNVLLTAQGERCLVFVRRRADAADVAERLAGDGFSALPLSGDLSQSQRNRALHAFRSGVIQILVATDVAARGIDVADISTVVHFEPPSEPEVFVHRSGRTGRAGRKGASVLLVPTGAERRVRRVLKLAKIEANWKPVPTAKSIDKAAVKAGRRRLHELLEQGVELSESERGYAEGLLERFDPATVVASLLRLCKAPLSREPMDVQPVNSRDEGDGPPRGVRRSSFGGTEPRRRRERDEGPRRKSWGRGAERLPARGRRDS